MEKKNNGLSSGARTVSSLVFPHFKVEAQIVIQMEKRTAQNSVLKHCSRQSLIKKPCLSVLFPA